MIAVLHICLICRNMLTLLTSWPQKCTTDGPNDFADQSVLYLGYYAITLIVSVATLVIRETLHVVNAKA